MTTVSRRSDACETLVVALYGLNKCRDFLLAGNKNQALTALWHVSQLVHLLPDNIVRKIIKIGKTHKDFKVRIETCYLADRWGKPEKSELLHELQNDSNPEVQKAFNELQTSTRESQVSVEIGEIFEKLWGGQMPAGLVQPVVNEIEVLATRVAVIGVSKEMVVPGTLFWILLEKEMLSFWGRMFVRAGAWYTIVQVQLSNPNQLEELKRFFCGPGFPEGKEGWRIFRDVYSRMLPSHQDDITESSIVEGDYGSQ